MFCRILPRSKPKDIDSAVTTFVDKAIKLKDAMIEELAVYRCFLVDNGQRVDESCFEMSDEGCVSGLVFLCMFPGLQQIVIQDQKPEILTLVKADGELRTKMTEKFIEDKSNKSIPEHGMADST